MAEITIDVQDIVPTAEAVVSAVVSSPATFAVFSEREGALMLAVDIRVIPGGSGGSGALYAGY